MSCKHPKWFFQDEGQTIVGCLQCGFQVDISNYIESRESALKNAAEEVKITREITQRKSKQVEQLELENKKLKELAVRFTGPRTTTNYSPNITINFGSSDELSKKISETVRGIYQEFVGRNS